LKLPTRNGGGKIKKSPNILVEKGTKFVGEKYLLVGLANPKNANTI
jgi:hypothetical protein